MFVRLKNEEGIVQLVNFSQAQKISPVKFEDDSMGIKVTWQHDVFTDHGEDDLPDDSCNYSEEIFVDITVQQIEGLLARMGLVFAPVVRGEDSLAKNEDAATEESEEPKMHVVDESKDSKEVKPAEAPAEEPVKEEPKKENPKEEAKKESKTSTNKKKRHPDHQGEDFDVKKEEKPDS